MRTSARVALVVDCIEASATSSSSPLHPGVAAKLESDSANVYLFMSSALGYLIASLAQFVTGLLLALYEGWQLAFVVCAAMPVLMCAGHRMGKEIEHYTAIQQNNFAKAAAVAEESLLAVRSVAAFGGEALEAARFERQLLPAKLGGIRSGAKIGAAWGVLNFFYPGLYALALWFGGHVLMSEENAGFEPSRIVTVMISMMVGVSGLSAFSGFAPLMAKAAVSARAMQEVIRCQAREIERPLYTQEELPAELSKIETIEFRKVSFRYPARLDKWVLSNFSFRAEQGQKIALVGESGCGKSTTIQLLERFYDATTGEVLVNGLHLNQVPAKAWRKLVGYVGQEPVLFATTVMKNLKAMDASITDEQAIEAAKAAQIYETLSQLPEGFNTFVGTGGGLLSGGQRQRVAIARALAKHPQVLLLDEATSALDNESERLVQDTLDSESMRHIMTISVAHRLTTIKGSDVIYVLKDGCCHEQGSHEQLMEKQGLYYSMARLQQAKGDESEQGEDKEEPVSECSTQRVEEESKAGAGLTQREDARLETQDSMILPSSGTAPHASSNGSVWCRLFGMMNLYWWVLPVGVLVVMAGAATMPLEAVYFNSAVVSLSEAANGNLEAMYAKLDTAVVGLAVVGLASGVAVLCQNSLFAYVQESLCLILRKAAFTSIICMDMSFFDAPENQTASILVSLETHMNRVGEMLGIQLGNSAAAMFTCVLSIGFSLFGCWELALLLEYQKDVSGS